MIGSNADATLSRYLAGAITAEHAADLLGPGVSVAEVVVETGKRFGRLPERDDAFERQEFARALELLGLSG